MLNKKGFALSLFETGTELIAERKLQTAISFLDRAIELDPSYSAAYYFRGSAYAALNNQDIAIENLANALKTAKEGAFKDFVTAGLAALNNKPADSCNHLKMAINAKSVIFQLHSPTWFSGSFPQVQHPILDFLA